MAEVMVIVSGPSGVGKSTVCKEVARRTGAFLSVSVTTRPRRPNEVDGQDYTFISMEQMEALVAEAGVLEYAKVYSGNYYGTPTRPVQKALDAGRPVILEIEIDGTLQVKRRYPRAIGVYMIAPTLAEQQNRLRNRRQDSETAIAERMSKAEQEIERARKCGAYECFLTNQRLEDTVEALVNLIEERRAR